MTKWTSNDILDDVVAHDLDLLLKVKDLTRDHLGRLKVIISQTVTDRVNITNAKTYEVSY